MPKFVQKEIDKKKSIGLVAKELGIQTHVIRFWETKFDQIKPFVGKGDRRYYFSKDVAVLKKIKHYLYDEGYTISGLQKLLSSRNSERRNLKQAEYLVHESGQGQLFNSDQSGSLSSLKKQQVEEIMKNIDIKLQKFTNLINSN